ncbi:cell division protein FtsW [Nakamurella sp. UYEF19]|uniref:putative lipid II flippase FtsW n=1 Tax=Nakamurella sp. UYEF19 TaxID=1756392 RepID=UPI00339646D5
MTSTNTTRGVSSGGSGRRPLSGLRRTAKDWLDRPMTSWHLIIGITFLMLGFGLLMVLSASSIASFHANGGAPFATFENQAIFAVIGLSGFLFASRLSVRVMRTFSFPLVAVCLALLAAVLLPGIGKRTGGARSWIDLGPIQFQPSEVAKLALLIWMGHTLAARRNTLRSIRALLFPVLPIFVLMVGLIMLEPDLGTTVSLGIVFIAVLWFAGAPWWMFAGLTAAGGAVVVYLATSAGYRSARIATWLDPGSASKAAVYQIHQSYYSLGTGGLFGAGLGASQAKFGWLPNADSDFIFAVIGEELGLVGAGLVLLLFGMLAYTGLRIARRNVDPFIKIVASAATIWLVGQAAINIGYVVGLLPVTGIPLPMISRGGTSLVITMVVFGLLANFARREPHAAAALRSQGPGRMARFLGLGAKPPKPPKARRPPKARKPATARPARRPQRPVRSTAVSDPGRSAERTVRRRAEPARRSGRSVRVDGQDSPNRTERQARPDSAARWAGYGPGADRTPPPHSPSLRSPVRLRRSGDSRGTLPSADWQGRSFVEPDRRPRRGRP